ncbi:ATP-dependent DNA helicase RecG, partial [bacterium]|nr:ATP-dependent DNA helicase RecG [bacterium]
GPSLGSRLKYMGYFKVADLFALYPRRYEDRTSKKKINELVDGEFVSISAWVLSKKEQKIRRNLTISKVTVTDSSRYPLLLVFFNQPYKIRTFSNGTKLSIFGKVEFKTEGWTIQNPDIELEEEEEHLLKVNAIYPLSENLSQKTIKRIIKTNLELYSDLFVEFLPSEILERRNLLGYKEAINLIHLPQTWEDIAKAKKRLAYNELFLFQLKLLLFRNNRRKVSKNRQYSVNLELLEKFQKCIPFKLTNAQLRTIKEIMVDLLSPYAMNRLIQGDVGSGKTVVAVAGIFFAVENGFQTAIMAPTEILAFQHFKKFSQYLGYYGINTELLTGSTKKKDRDYILSGLKDGSIKVVVGTHALIQEDVEFKNLAFTVVDEQHRFGVMQRTALQQKGINADNLVMTATPIPRTLSMTLYGDLNISIIDELPPNRKVIKSYFRQIDKLPEVCNYIKEEIRKGRQAYIVCPLIDESDKIEAKSAIETAEELKNGVFSDLRVSLLHGKMKPSEKENIMDEFRKNNTDVLISTTVIEVGVDVPNATIMVIMNSERFGLAQLHQLRGRIGRGSFESICFFIGNVKSQEGLERMKTMVRERDGFKIAEKDLEMRGPGDFCGTKQHGLPMFRIADLTNDLVLMQMAREDADYILETNPKYVEREDVKDKMNMLTENFNDIIN